MAVQYADLTGQGTDVSRHVALVCIAGHIDAGADEVIFSFAFADVAGITALGEAFRLAGR